MSTGRTVEGLVVRDSRKSEARTRKRAVFVSAEAGIFRCAELEFVRRVFNQLCETESDFVFRI
jgi:hypothetical protein